MTKSWNTIQSCKHQFNMLFSYWQEIRAVYLILSLHGPANVRNLYPAIAALLSLFDDFATGKRGHEQLLCIYSEWHHSRPALQPSKLFVVDLYTQDGLKILIDLIKLEAAVECISIPRELPVEHLLQHLLQPVVLWCPITFDVKESIQVLGEINSAELDLWLQWCPLPSPHFPKVMFLPNLFEFMGCSKKLWEDFFEVMAFFIQ